MTGPDGATHSAHWDGVYHRLDEHAVSWFEPEPTCSLRLLDDVGATPDQSIIDIGAGASRLVDALLARDFSDVTALDVSDTGLARTRCRLGSSADQVQWIVADLLTWTPPRRYQVWHDRAVFHFLTDPADQARYRALLDAALLPDARVVVGTFAHDGPQHCSNLPIARYTPAALAHALDLTVEPSLHRREVHRTPAGTIQPFTWIAGRRSEPT